MSGEYTPYRDKKSYNTWNEWDNRLPQTRERWERTMQGFTALSDKIELSLVFGEEHPHRNRDFVPLERKAK